MTNGTLEKRIQVGSSSASIFINEVKTENGTVKLPSVVPQRTYKDASGDYQNVNTYGLKELPQVILALQKAYEHVAMKKYNDGL